MNRTKWNDALCATTGTGQRRQKHHDQEISSLCSEARQRLAVLQLDRELEDAKLFRFRVGGTERLWGFRRGGCFYVLWWDPDHQVYPTEPG